MLSQCDDVCRCSDQFGGAWACAVAAVVACLTLYVVLEQRKAK